MGGFLKAVGGGSYGGDSQASGGTQDNALHITTGGGGSGGSSGANRHLIWLAALGVGGFVLVHALK